MSIIIKGEVMPECCAECPCMRHDNWNGDERYQCNVKLIHFGEFDSWIFEKRPNWCPLEEVKEAEP